MIQDHLLKCAEQALSTLLAGFVVVRTVDVVLAGTSHAVLGTRASTRNSHA